MKISKTKNVLFSLSGSTHMMHQKFGDLLLPKRNCYMLDIGCNDGTLTAKWGNRLRTKNIYGIDVDSNAIKEAKRKGINAVVADVDNNGLAFRDESFDVVCSNQVIEHIANTDQFVTEIYRVLKRGGYTVIGTPNLAAWQHMVSLLLGGQPRGAHVCDRCWHVGTALAPTSNEPRRSVTRGHLRVFTWASLPAMFAIYGFRIEQRTAAGWMFLPSNWLGKLMSELDSRHSTFIFIRGRKP